jgi:flavin-dependent dehydrogenase
MSGSDRTDVLVAGGGPAGLAAAIAMRMAGFDVTLVEPKRPPIDKACGEGLMPDGALLLERLGVRLPPGESYLFRGIEFIEGAIRARAAFRIRPGVGTRRTTLHAALARRAASAGVRLMWGHAATVEAGGTARIDGKAMDARWIIGADGGNSRIRRTLGLDAPPVYKRFGTRRHYAMRPWSDSVQVWWSDRCEAYVTPVGPKGVCLALLIHDSSLRFDEALASFPDLERRLDPATAERDEIATGNIFRRVPRVIQGNVALLGDASGTVDAITGMGITLAAHQAILLARSLAAGSLEPYQAAHRSLGRLAAGMTRFMLDIDRSPRLRHSTLRALASLPGLFPFMLRLHTRDLPFVSKGALDALRPAETTAVALAAPSRATVA